MDELAREYGASVILLTFHVDYWDYLGWKDTFSSAPYTERQKVYGQAFNQDSIYTPEMVIQGEVGFNGSALNWAKREIAKRLETRRPALHLKLEKKSADTILVSVELPPELSQGSHRLSVVVYEDAPPVNVLRGENRGVTMSGAYAVRALESMAPAVDGRSHQTLKLVEGWNPAKVGVAVLVQDASPAILAAEAAPWP